MLLLLLYPSSFKGEAKPLFYLQPCALMFLCFLPCFFGKVCLFVIPQRACSSSSAFNLASSTRRASSHACFSSTLCLASPLLSALLLRQGVPIRHSSASLLLFLSFQPCLFNKACLLALNLTKIGRASMTRNCHNINIVMPSIGIR